MPEYNYPGYGPSRQNWLTSRSNTVGGYHGGNDNPAEPGTPVYAQYGGTVFRSGNIKGYGMTVVVRSTAPDGTVFYQLYGHLGPGPLPAPDTPVTADQPIPGAAIGTKEYVQRLGGITSGPHLHREIISDGAKLNKKPNEPFGTYSSDITYKADPDAFDINHPVFPYAHNEAKPPPQPALTASPPRFSPSQPSLPGSAPPPGNPQPTSTPQLAPGMAIPDPGPTSIGGPDGPRSLLPLSRSGQVSPSPAPAADPMLPPLHFAPRERRNFGPFAVPGLFRSGVVGGGGAASAAARPNAPVLPTPDFGAPGAFAPAASPAMPGSGGQIGDGNGIGDWWGGLAPAASSNNAVPPVRRVSSRFPDIVPVDPSQPPRGAAAPIGTAGETPSLPPVRFPLEALLAPDRSRALHEWASSTPRRAGVPPTASVFDNGTAPIPYAPTPAQNTPGGLPGLIASVAGIDPSNPDQPPAGGLLALLQEYLRNNPDGDSIS